MTHGICEDAHFRILVKFTVICVFIKLYFKNPYNSLLYIFDIHIYLFVEIYAMNFFKSYEIHVLHMLHLVSSFFFQIEFYCNLSQLLAVVGRLWSALWDPAIQVHCY